MYKVMKKSSIHPWDGRTTSAKFLYIFGQNEERNKKGREKKKKKNNTSNSLGN